MLTKTCPVSVKAVDIEAGTFEAIVSVFGNKDSYGDVVMPGAFVDTLAEWAKSGSPIPVYWSHRMEDPDYNIGEVLEAKETDVGLWVKAQLDLEGPKAPQVHRLLKSRRVTQFSFAYDVEDMAWAKSEELGEYMELRKVKLYEVGPTPIGANQETDLLAVKSATRAAEHLAASLKAGRVISTKNENLLRTAHESIGQVLDALTTDDQEKNAGTVPAKTEEPTAAKVEEPITEPTVSPLDALVLLELDLVSSN